MQRTRSLLSAQIGRQVVRSRRGWSPAFVQYPERQTPVSIYSGNAAAGAIGGLAKLREADVDIPFSLGYLLALAGLGYGAWLCLLHAAKYDAESIRAEIAASRAARTRGHSEAIVEYQGVDQAGRISQSPVA